MRIFKALLLPLLLILSLLGVDRLAGKDKIFKHPQPPAGAGSLAKTAALPTSVPADPALSRVNPLPQGMCVWRWGCESNPAMGR